ncbi:hypothetical protein L914_08516 [Phytophthora nicotianae]|uniref:Uncharacterized protein n=2 Tax=Phytophthora nicotianae TaxID=4792 RepID=W2NFA7_PHYNI|nr:hypothetical protein L914_08516 [Phytophthora nicotianae]
MAHATTKDGYGNGQIRKHMKVKAFVPESSLVVGLKRGEERATSGLVSRLLTRHELRCRTKHGEADSAEHDTAPN